MKLCVIVQKAKCNIHVILIGKCTKYGKQMIKVEFASRSELQQVSIIWASKTWCSPAHFGLKNGHDDSYIWDKTYLFSFYQGCRSLEHFGPQIYHIHASGCVVNVNGAPPVQLIKSRGKALSYFWSAVKTKELAALIG